MLLLLLRAPQLPAMTRVYTSNGTFRKSLFGCEGPCLRTAVMRPEDALEGWEEQARLGVYPSSAQDLGNEG